MSQLLAGVQTTNQAQAETDRLGGFQLLDSGVHRMAIELAYLSVSQGGARALVIHAKSDTGSLRTTQYFTSGQAKGCKTYYEKDGKHFNLPGFTTVNDIASLAGLGDINGLEVEEKVIKLWSADAGQEVPTKTQVVTNLLGKYLAFGVLRQVVDKQAKDNDGNYQPTGETREENELNKVFCAESGRTAVEAQANANSAEEVEASFIAQWKDKYDGEIINKASKTAQAGNAGAPTKAQGTGKALFK